MALFAQRQRGGETTESGVVARQAETQQIVGPLETAAPDMLLGPKLAWRARHRECRTRRNSAVPPTIAKPAAPSTLSSLSA